MRLNTARECYHTSLWIKDYGKLFNAPLFLLHGLNDRITNPQLSIDFYNKMPNKRKEIYSCPTFVPVATQRPIRRTY